MTQPRKQVLTAEAAAERPHRLVLHFNPGGPDSHGLFDGVIRSATQLEGLREVTVDLSEAGLEAFEALDSTGAAIVKDGFGLRASVRAEQVLHWGAAAFSACRQVDVRMDFGKTPTLRVAPEVFQAAQLLHVDSRVVSLQVLLDHTLVTRLTPARLRVWLDRADFVTLAAPRHREPDFVHHHLVALFDRLSPLWESPDRFFHLQVDRSIKPAFFPWNLLSATCPAADLALHLEADGRLFLCAARTPFALIETPARFAETIEHHLALHPGEACEGPWIDAR